MYPVVSIARMPEEQNQTISDVIERERIRLWRFIRKRVADRSDAEDILQDVFYEMVEAYRLTQPIEQVAGWLYRVARNRIIDLFRKKKPEITAPQATEEESSLSLVDLLPSSDGSPETAYAQTVLFEELEDALDELPQAQREVFIAHELEGRSFKELAAETGVSVNTLLSRKRYAVLHLRRRLRAIHDEYQKG
jgi:RNA polymerase sigma factor (sigma-70 family)